MSNATATEPEELATVHGVALALLDELTRRATELTPEQGRSMSLAIWNFMCARRTLVELERHSPASPFRH